MEKLVAKLLEKSELVSAPPKLVEEFVHKHLTAKAKKKYEELGTRFFKSKEYDLLRKEVRSELREIYGVFFEQQNKNRDKLLNKLIKDPSIDNHLKLLELHKSTKERLPFYVSMYKQLWEEIGKPKSILDLACGYNVFSYPLMQCNPTYYGIDLSEDDAKFLNKYLESQNIKGECSAADLTQISANELPEAEVVFLLKTLDSLETRKRHWSKKLLSELKAKNIVISFPTKSLGGKKSISTDRRKWLQKSFDVKPLFELPNEAFYLLKK